MTKTQEYAHKIKSILGLGAYPVGVKFYFIDEQIMNDVPRLSHHRYCQALMKARSGSHVRLDAESIACPAAAAAFGFKPLPQGLKTGKRLQGFGIVQHESAGKRMFEGMTRLEPNKLQALYLFPLEQAKVEPDIVVIEDEVEKLMWIALAKLNMQDGQRIESSTAVLQAICVDATVIPFVKNKFNMSFGCYGCRDATDVGPHEAVIGFPYSEFEDIAIGIEFLQGKAIPNSRSKNAFTLLKRKEAEKIDKMDPFNK